jgi:hypothetical protein
VKALGVADGGLVAFALDRDDVEDDRLVGVFGELEVFVTRSMSWPSIGPR